MNVPLRPPAPRAFDTAEVLRMFETGVLRRDERVELIEGVLQSMSPKHNRHEHYKSRLLRWFARRLSDDLSIGVESTRYLSDDTFVEPDISITRDGLPSDLARGEDLLLVIEISDTSLAYDFGVKARLYARHGVPEYWVIDAQAGRLFVMRGPSDKGYAATQEVGGEQTIAPLFAPSLELRLKDVA